MRQKRSGQRHQSRDDDYDHTGSSSYIQLRHHNNDSDKSTTIKQTTTAATTTSEPLFDRLLQITSHLTLYAIIILTVIIGLLLLIRTADDLLANSHTSLPPTFISSSSAPKSVFHRFRRDSLPLTKNNLSDKYHHIDMIRRMLLYGTSSSVPADCTLNMAVDGVYRLQKTSTAAQVIQLVEKNFEKELLALRYIANRIRQKLNPITNLEDFPIAKFSEEHSMDLRVLLATQVRLREIDLMTPLPSIENGSGNNGGYVYYNTIKYFRVQSNDQITNRMDYHNIQYETLRENRNILLNFNPSNARETLKQTTNTDTLRTLMNDGWWLGPVLCEKNKNETYLMANVFPLTNSYFLVTYVNISSVDINQCADENAPFGGMHKCPIGMECVFQSGHGFVLGAYECRCTRKIDNVTLTLNGVDLELNRSTKITTETGQFLTSIDACDCNPLICQLEYNRFLRTLALIIQSIFIVFVAILAAIVFQRRKTKIIKHSMWILLELVLFGAALLYASVIVDSFGPHGFVCLLMPWLREVGFTIVYGTLILRIYKMLAEFQSRKAHCVQVKEKDMLRILFFICISIIGYLLGWTLVNVDHSNDDASVGDYLLGQGFESKPKKRYFQTCRPRSWDFLVQIAEFVFLCVGVRFIYSTRTAPCEYHERKLITIAIVCEMFFSTLLHIIKDCLWATVNPDILFILSLIRCHTTVTVMIVLIFCTKLCYIFRPFNEEFTGRDRFRSLPDGVEPSDLVTKLQSNGDVEFGELNIRDMEPEEIRAELKRLYTSLHVLKTKTMRKDNPHLTKRHGQRRKNRRFSMQAFQRHGGTGSNMATAGGGGAGAGGTMSSVLGGGDKHEHEPTKTPEDSTGSHNEHTHLGPGVTGPRGSADENDDSHGRTLVDLTSSMVSTGAGQRVTFK